MEREETKLKEGWEQTRLIIAEIRSKPVYGYKIKPVSDARKMMPFPWDSESKEVDEDTLDELRKHMEEHNKKVRCQQEQ